MGHLVTEDLDRRLRASAPEIEGQAHDAALLERVRALPVEGARAGGGWRRSSRSPPRPSPPSSSWAAAPGAGRPRRRRSTRRCARFDPPEGTILHIRMTETARGETLEREVWQSAGDAARTRQVVRRGGTVYEIVGDSLSTPARTRSTSRSPGRDWRRPPARRARGG